MSHCEASAAAVRERELLVALAFSRMPALLPLLPTAPSATGMSPSCVRRSPRSGPSASMLSNRNHVSSGGRLINCLFEAKILCHLTLMRLPCISYSTTRLPVFEQLLRALMNLGSLQPQSGVSSVSLLQSHRLRSSRWCWLCPTSSACLTLVATKEERQRACAVLGWLFFWSLEHGVVPSSMKSAYITPILKKADLDASDPKSYRPISNLSKLLERLVSKQFVAYLLENDLFPDLQSAYRTIITRRRLLFSRSCRISYHCH